MTPPDGLTSISFTDRVNRLNAGLVRDGIPVSDLRRAPALELQFAGAGELGRTHGALARPDRADRGTDRRGAALPPIAAARVTAALFPRRSATHLRRLALRSGADGGDGGRRRDPHAIPVKTARGAGNVADGALLAHSA